MEEPLMKNIRDWYDETTQDQIRDFLDVSEPFFFRFRGNDYHIERFIEGVAIRRPVYAYDENLRQMCYAIGFPNSDYPESFKAKSIEEFLCLPFLDGKTLFERFDELLFFDLNNVNEFL